MATRRILLEDGSRLLLEDGTNFLLLEGVAQASDDVLIRLGPGVAAGTGSGLVAPAFTASTPPGGGGGVTSSFYYNMMQEWFSSV
jgi:hypothetical protein